MATAVKLLAYLGLALMATGFAWLTYKTFSDMGWGSFRRFFIEDRPFLLMLLGMLVLLMAFGLKSVSQ